MNMNRKYYYEKITIDYYLYYPLCLLRQVFKLGKRK